MLQRERVPKQHLVPLREGFYRHFVSFRVSIVASGAGDHLAGRHLAGRAAWPHAALHSPALLTLHSSATGTWPRAEQWARRWARTPASVMTLVTNNKVASCCFRAWLLVSSTGLHRCCTYSLALRSQDRSPVRLLHLPKKRCRSNNRVAVKY